MSDTPSPDPDTGLFAVRLEGILKRCPGVIANRDINLAVRSGTIHAIVGENGAGKSTLMKILYGMQKPDGGTIEVNGELVTLRSPTDAIDLGIGMVHQHFMLANNFTVLENVILGYEPRSRFPFAFHINRRAARDRIRELSDAYGLDLDPDTLVENLGVGERQRVEILKVLFRGARILILDEPTAVLVPQEVKDLFDNLAGLKAQGISILFISHKLDEVLSVADDITVVRGGTTVATRRPGEVTARQLAELMVGSELPSPELRESTVTDHMELEVADLTSHEPDGRTILDDIDLRIHRGEIVGIAGVEGNGQSELIAAIMGLLPANEGTISLDGQDITGWSTRRRREAGIGYIPQDRHRHGLLLDAPLWENQILGHQSQPPNANGFWIDRDGARKRTTEVVERYDVRTPSIDVNAESLSGGNQQKLIIGREMMANPSVIIAAHPTRGVDVGAQAAIWDQLRDARGAGLATLLISADLEELIGLSDRLLVIYKGRIVAELDPATATPEELGSYMTGAGPATKRATERATEPSPTTDVGAES